MPPTFIYSMYLYNSNLATKVIPQTQIDTWINSNILPLYSNIEIDPSTVYYNSSKQTANKVSLIIDNVYNSAGTSNITNGIVNTIANKYKIQLSTSNIIVDSLIIKNYQRTTI